MLSADCNAARMMARGTMNGKAKITFTNKPPKQVGWSAVRSLCGNIVAGVDECGAVRFVAFAKKDSAQKIIEEWNGKWPGAIFKKGGAVEKRMVNAIAALANGKQAGKLECSVNATHFQRLVWAELAKIPFGKTASYGEIASRIGKPKAARAVGNACGQNPVPIVVPCHRVIAGDGGIGGFSSDIGIKKTLLRLEQKL